MARSLAHARLHHPVARLQPLPSNRDVGLGFCTSTGADVRHPDIWPDPLRDAHLHPFLTMSRPVLAPSLPATPLVVDPHPAPEPPSPSFHSPSPAQSITPTSTLPTHASYPGPSSSEPWHLLDPM
ncbi:hypothetical protein NLJ89_g12122 [Agrocybe chaxingu]|uniref:Uncharacterized protein n=1 Tax=Agrocybe chaxingu TaxID=84603 RepID=A0A9W8JMG6_9AGAR|nr:hypothetical protein NLJ89_g12122 [Agrocybe chaxingu]